jgi:hypothetical protein
MEAKRSSGNVGSIHKIYTAPHPRRPHSSIIEVERSFKITYFSFPVQLYALGIKKKERKERNIK